ncbi:hypothetical protein V6N12_069102 [Hibiscus sabdariffa]|uniref:Uncharacterized protein n=1 Tax=Hibiscus sabdariffa TaxID=183260 RepID=A0ABR2FCV7_9ROSI
MVQSRALFVPRQPVCTFYANIVRRWKSSFEDEFLWPSDREGERVDGRFGLSLGFYGIRSTTNKDLLTDKQGDSKEGFSDVAIKFISVLEVVGNVSVGSERADDLHVDPINGEIMVLNNINVEADDLVQDHPQYI